MQDTEYVDGGYQCEHLSMYARCKFKARETVQLKNENRVKLCHRHSKIYREVFDCEPVEQSA